MIDAKHTASNGDGLRIIGSGSMWQAVFGTGDNARQIGRGVTYEAALDAGTAELRKWLDSAPTLLDQRDDLQQWVNDLQAGMYINCVYCGHRYGPDDEVPAAMADVLREHVEQCPKHPMSALKTERDALLTAARAALAWHSGGAVVVPSGRLIKMLSAAIALAEGEQR